MVTQIRVRHDNRRGYTKHMIWLRLAAKSTTARPTKYSAGLP